MYRALLVDDESLALEGLNLLVDWQGAGFVVCGQAENGQEALALMEQLRPHLVVTDLYMPLMDGLTLMQAARESGFEGQFIIVSGYSDFQIARSALKLKPAGYLLKPIDPDEAAATLARVRAELNKQQEKRAPVMSRRVHRVMEMIKTEYAQNLTIAQIAETVGYNAAYLGRAFDQETGMSIREYLAKVRTEKAAALLRTGGRTAEEIAQLVGYANYPLFWRQFKAAFGVSPEAYRDSLLKKFLP